MAGFQTVDFDVHLLTFRRPHPPTFFFWGMATKMSVMMMHLYDLFTADKLLQLWSQFLHDRKKQEQALWTLRSTASHCVQWGLAGSVELFHDNYCGHVYVWQQVNEEFSIQLLSSFSLKISKTTTDRSYMLLSLYVFHDFNTVCNRQPLNSLV